MVKVKFTCNWDSDQNLKKRVIANFITEDNLHPEIEITDKDDYDYLFVFNRLVFQPKVSKEKIYTFIMEPSWSPNWDRNCFNYSNKVFVHDKNLFGNYENIIESPSFMFYHMNSEINNIGKLLNNNQYEHKKKMSMVVSYTPGCDYNYGIRTNLALKILEHNLDVDIYGNRWKINHKNIKGPVQDKYNALIDYQYSIGIENSCEKNYLTEKFFDISLCNSHPIYYGAPNISEIYKNYTPINPNNIEETLDVLSDLIKNNNYDFGKVNENKKLYFNKYNLYNKIKEIILLNSNNPVT